MFRTTLTFFHKPISGRKMPWCHLGSAINYVRFREIRMQKLGFWASMSRCQSAVPTVTPLPTSTTPAAPPETTFPGCLFHWKKLDVRSQAHQQLGSVSVCRGAGLSKRGGIMSTSADCTQTQTTWPLQVIFLHDEKSKKSAENFNLIWNVFWTQSAAFSLPFHFVRVAEYSHQPTYLHV